MNVLKYLFGVGVAMLAFSIIAFNLIIVTLGVVFLICGVIGFKNDPKYKTKEKQSQ